MLKKVLIGLVVVILAAVVFVSTRPSEFRLERSTTISAPADVAFGFVNDLHQWNAWSPWEKLDPAMKRTFAGPPAGVGAIYEWVGKDDVGEGRMTITESRPNDAVVIKLEFIKPFATTNQIDLTFKQAGESTNVTWAMSGSNGFMMKAMSAFMDMEKMVGPDFEKGLAQLKEASEAEAKKRVAEAEAKKTADSAAAAAPVAP
jgi:hypothetical protein